MNSSKMKVLSKVTGNGSCPQFYCCIISFSYESIACMIDECMILSFVKITELSIFWRIQLNISYEFFNSYSFSIYWCDSSIKAICFSFYSRI